MNLQPLKLSGAQCAEKGAELAADLRGLTLHLASL